MPSNESGPAPRLLDVTDSARGASFDPNLISVALGVPSVRFASAFFEAPIGMAVLDLEGRYRAANPALCSLLGRAQEELIGRLPIEFTHPDDRRPSARSLGALQAGVAQSESAQKRFFRPDGAEVCALRTTSVLEDEAGTRVGFFTQVVDLTDLLNSQRALETSDRRYRALLHHATDVVFLVDPSGTIVYASPPSERFFGRAPADVVGTSPFALIHPDDLDRARRSY